jgi:hypothetical protein
MDFCSLEKEENDFSSLCGISHISLDFYFICHRASGSVVLTIHVRIEMTSTAKSEATPPDVVQAMFDNSLKGAAIRGYRFSYFRGIICCH